MIRYATIASVLVLSGFSPANAFVIPSKTTFTSALCASKGDGDEVVQQKALTVGTLVEFEEKKRTHVGKITASEHKSNGGARYSVEDHDGHKFDIPDKAVHYAMSITPDNERKVAALFDEFAVALEEGPSDLRKDLDISPELLQMAWEEAIEDEDSSHEITGKSLVELIHAHSASALDAYKAWRLLRTESSHIFFKEIKSHGRVVAFKAKTTKAVENAKRAFCTKAENAEEDLCFV
mmetsp:Transcript_15454/g.25770  ORF Transcript_15454/g.25770 Transcript_15454/m.25770 type:complete len:236 (-) Transcript_15454:214-921(-)